MINMPLCLQSTTDEGQRTNSSGARYVHRRNCRINHRRDRNQGNNSSNEKSDPCTIDEAKNMKVHISHVCTSLPAIVTGLCRLIKRNTVRCCAKVMLNFESAGRELRSKSRMYSRHLKRGRATGTYSTASSVMNSPTTSPSSSSFKIPDIDRDPLGNAGDPNSRFSQSLNSILPDIPRLSFKSLRATPSSNSAREQRDVDR